MSELDRLQDGFMKADALAQQGDEQARADAALFAQEIRRLQSGAEPEVDRSFLGEEGFMAQLNRGIAETAGGLVDFVNPFDEYTGSAATGLKNVMGAAGINTAEQDPEGFLQNIAYGTGAAAGSVIPLTKAAQALQQAPGMIGRVAQTVAPQMATRAAVGGELVSGGLAAGGAGEAERQGYSEPVQQIVGLLSGMSPAVAVPAVRSALSKPVELVKRELLPYTKAGGMAIAREKMIKQVGGEDEAKKVYETLESADESIIGLTPMQQTGNPRLMEVERVAQAESPQLKERLQARQAAADLKAREELNVGGSIEDAQNFVAKRKAEFSDTINNYIETAKAVAQSKIPKSDMDTASASEAVARELRQAEKLAKTQQKILWERIPQDLEIDVSPVRSSIKSLIDSATRISQENIPTQAIKFLKATEGSGTDQISEVNSLYSAMRDAARNATAGQNVNMDQARMANEIADSILKNFDNIPADSAVNRAIIDARTFSREMHDKFSRDDVGRLLKRDSRGGDSIRQGLTLEETVGRGGDRGSYSQEDILKAMQGVPDTGATVNASKDYLRNMFNSAAFPAGNFSRNAAASFISSNKRLIDQFPDVRAELEQAISSQARLSGVEARAADISKSLGRSEAVAFAESNAQKALGPVLSARRPKMAMANLIATAKKDPTGAAMAGLKRAVSQELIEGSISQLTRATEAGAASQIRFSKLSELLKDETFGSIVKQVYSKADLANARIIAKELEKLDLARVGDSVGNARDVLEPSGFLVTAARVAGANVGAMVGSSTGSSLQTAAIFSARFADFANKLIKSQAEKLIKDAIEDRELLRQLLIVPKTEADVDKLKKVLTPYLVGSVAGTNEEASGDQDQPIMVPREPLRIGINPMSDQ